MLNIYIFPAILPDVFFNFPLYFTLMGKEDFLFSRQQRFNSDLEGFGDFLYISEIFLFNAWDMLIKFAVKVSSPIPLVAPAGNRVWNF